MQIIDEKLMERVVEQAKESPGLRMKWMGFYR